MSKDGICWRLARESGCFKLKQRAAVEFEGRAVDFGCRVPPTNRLKGNHVPDWRVPPLATSPPTFEPEICP